MWSTNCRKLKWKDGFKGLWLKKFQVSSVTCLGVNSVRVWFEKWGACAAVLKLQFSLCISHCISGQKSFWGTRMLCLKPELGNFLTTTKLLTLGNSGCFHTAWFSLLCISPFHLFRQKLLNLSWFFSLKQNENRNLHVCSLAEELVCVVGIVTTVGVRRWNCLFECLLI